MSTSETFNLRNQFGGIIAISLYLAGLNETLKPSAAWLKEEKGFAMEETELLLASHQYNLDEYFYLLTA